MKINKRVPISVIFIFFLSQLLSEPVVKVLKDPAAVPGNVKYIKSSESINAGAIERIKRLCTKNMITRGEVPQAIMIGPRLYGTLKNVKEITGEPSIEAIVKVPVSGKTVQLTAGVIRFKERTYNLLYAFQGIISKSKKVTIRKPSKNELSYYWAMISYDIKEPVYTIELDDSKYLIDFSDNQEFFYIEDVSALK